MASHDNEMAFHFTNSSFKCYQKAVLRSWKPRFVIIKVAIIIVINTLRLDSVFFDFLSHKNKNNCEKTNYLIPLHFNLNQ